MSIVDEISGSDDSQDCTLEIAGKFRRKDMHLFSALKRTFNDVARMTDEKLEKRPLSGLS